VLERGLALCRASGDRNALRQIATGLGYAYALQGRLAEGHALLEEGVVYLYLAANSVTRQTEYNTLISPPLRGDFAMVSHLFF